MMTQLCKDLQGRGPIETLSQSGVQAMGDSVQLTLGIARQVCTLGEVLVQQAVGVLVDAALPENPFPTPLDTFLENSTVAIFLGRRIRRYVPAIRGLYLRTWPQDSVRIVPWVKGAALAIRRETFDQVGGFDESFFMYFEDAELCHRLGKVDWEIHFAPITTVVHLEGASTDQYRASMAVQLLDSTDLFYQRHSSRLSIAVMNAIVKSLMLAKYIIGTLRLSFTRDANRRRVIAECIATSHRVLRRNRQWDRQ